MADGWRRWTTSKCFWPCSLPCCSRSSLFLSPKWISENQSTLPVTMAMPLGSAHYLPGDRLQRERVGDQDADVPHAEDADQHGYPTPSSEPQSRRNQRHETELEGESKKHGRPEVRKSLRCQVPTNAVAARGGESSRCSPRAETRCEGCFRGKRGIRRRHCRVFFMSVSVEGFCQGRCLLSFGNQESCKHRNHSTLSPQNKSDQVLRRIYPIDSNAKHVDLSTAKKDRTKLTGP